MYQSIALVEPMGRKQNYVICLPKLFQSLSQNSFVTAADYEDVSACCDDFIDKLVDVVS